MAAAPAQAAAPLRDIAGHWAQIQIQELADQGVVAGLPDGSFGPDQPLTGRNT